MRIGLFGLKRWVGLPLVLAGFFQVAPTAVVGQQSCVVSGSVQYIEPLEDSQIHGSLLDVKGADDCTSRISHEVGAGGTEPGHGFIAHLAPTGFPVPMDLRLRLRIENLEPMQADLYLKRSDNGMFDFVGQLVSGLGDLIDGEVYVATAVAYQDGISPVVVKVMLSDFSPFRSCQDSELDNIDDED
ncbi:MAG: hypothetical protein K0U98_01870 [Deltaproteobacteria bacterium]|nr:hypothetical protein [Deltaproteobacteria bacterium]